MPLPKTKREAIALGAPTYYTGKQCKGGHFVERYAATGACTACQAEYSKRWALKRRQHDRAGMINVTVLVHQSKVKELHKIVSELNAASA